MGREKHPELMVTDSPEPTNHLKLQFAQHAPFVRSRHCCQFPCCRDVLLTAHGMLLLSGLPRHPALCRVCILSLTQ